MGLGLAMVSPLQWPRSAVRFLFGDSARAFGSLSVILLILLAIVPARDRFREWLSFQNDYANLIRDRADSAALARRFQRGIQQIWPAGTGRHRSLHYLPRGTERSVARWRRSALPPASAHSAPAHRIRLRHVPPGPGRGDNGRGSALQHEGLGAANPARAVCGVFLLTMP